MATPYSRSNSSGALGTGPSRTLLQQLLEEINGVSSTRTARSGSHSQSPASTYSLSSFQNLSPSPWLGGSALAQNARDKLRAVDDARRRRVAANVVDGAPNLQAPRLCLDTSRLDIQDTTLLDEHGRGAYAGLRRTPDPVRYPHEYLQYMLEGSPLSTNVGLSSEMQGRDNTLLHLRAPLLGDTIPLSLSPLIFSDVYFDDSSSLSPQTETTASPNEAPTSTATVYTAEELRTPTGDNVLKQAHCPNDSLTETTSQKRHTVIGIPSEGYFEMAIDAPHGFIGVGGDNRCLLRHKNFTERAPTPWKSDETGTNDVLPELSSFRPTDAGPQGQPRPGPPAQRTSHALTSPLEPASPAVPDDPAWTRPMQLVDIGGKSIYMNVHDDGPIRHALCLWCFRTRGDFRKVHKHGYESCGRKEVLDSHYWEDDKWPGDSSDESAASDH